MRRCGSTSSPSSLAVAPLLFLLLLLVAGCFHVTAAARLPPSSVPDTALVHHAAAEKNGVRAAAAGGAADGGLQVLQEGGVGNGDELSISDSEMMGADQSEEACEEGNEDCMQRRLLQDAHLDYIYTQHRGKP